MGMGATVDTDTGDMAAMLGMEEVMVMVVMDMEVTDMAAMVMEVTDMECLTMDMVTECLS